MATVQSVAEMEQASRAPREIRAPASTSWPLVLALGFTLMFAGLLTSASVSALGAVLTAAGCAGWFREVFPREHEVVLRVAAEAHRLSRNGPWSTGCRLRRIRCAPGFLCRRTRYRLG